MSWFMDFFQKIPNWVVVHPLDTLNNQGPFFHCSNSHSISSQKGTSCCTCSFNRLIYKPHKARLDNMLVKGCADGNLKVLVGSS